MKIAIMYDPYPVRSAEPTVPETVSALQVSLVSEHDVILMEHNDRMEDYLLAVWPDIVLNLTRHAEKAEYEGDIPALLERWYIPFTGSSTNTMRLCLDTAAARRVLRRKGVATPVCIVVQSPEEARDIERFPLRVTPLFGAAPEDDDDASIVHTARDLRVRIRHVVETYEQMALVETYLPGREFIVSLLGNGLGVKVLPIVERQAASTPVHAMSASTAESPRLSVDPRQQRFLCPVDISAELARRMADLSRQAFVTLQCHDFGSVRVRLDEAEQPYVLALNPMPGLLPRPQTPSAFLRAVETAEMTLPDLGRRILRLASQRYKLNA